VLDTPTLFAYTARLLSIAACVHIHAEGSFLMKQHKFLLAAGLAMVLAALMVSPALAGGTLFVHTLSIDSINCGTGQVNVTTSIWDDTGAWSHTVTITNMTTGVSVTTHTASHSSGTLFTEAVGGNLGVMAGGTTLSVTSQTSSLALAVAPRSVTVTGRCDDGRINLQPWSAATIYCSAENGITIWQLKNGKSGQVLNATAAELAALPAKPASNTLIKQVGDIALYKLTTGEYQLNVGPDFEGKTQVFIWRGCLRDTLYFHELKVQTTSSPVALMGGRIVL
jgi:hypothetical protein